MTSGLPTYVVDSFTDVAFSGNPAGVVLLDADREDSWLQSVAAELKHSETAFLAPLPAPCVTAAPIGLRWFTPTIEVDLCGHATLASAHVLYALGFTGHLRFSTRSGQLDAHPGVDGSIVLDFPSRPPVACEEIPGLAGALGVAPVWVGRGGDHDVLVEVADEATVRSLTPDIRALSGVDARGIIVTAAADETSPYDVVTRFFAPRAGIAEDPVTGSAHTAVAPYWAPRIGRTELLACQASERGGTLRLQVIEDRVLIAGHAVTVLEGTLLA